MLSSRDHSNAPSPFSGLRVIAINAAVQYVHAGLATAIKMGETAVTRAEIPRSTLTLTRGTKYAVAELVRTPITAMGRKRMEAWSAERF